MIVSRCDHDSIMMKIMIPTLRNHDFYRDEIIANHDLIMIKIMTTS